MTVVFAKVYNTRGNLLKSIIAFCFDVTINLVCVLNFKCFLFFHIYIKF